MRIAALVVVTLLVAGCSQTSSVAVPPHPSTTSATSVTSASPSSSKPGTAAAAPPAGAPIAAVIAWIEAAHAADPARYKRDPDVAFSVPSSKTQCTTDSKHTPGTLSCLVALSNPPPQPDSAYGEWKGGWVDFDGTTLRIGAARADPGPFLAGAGAELANGDSLSFADFRCRADQAGVFCVNYAHQSAVRYAAAGVESYGCLHPAPAPEGVATAFSCP